MRVSRITGVVDMSLRHLRTLFNGKGASIDVMADIDIIQRDYVIC